MNILIRVQSAQATAQMKALQGQITALQTRSAVAGSAFGNIFSARAMSPLVKAGNQLQWTGRQLQYNFTLPILLAGAAATKFALDNEKAFVRIVKVYGDVGMAQQQVTNETNALKKAFVELSNQFGVQQSQVLDIAGAWAAAGASGVALAKDVKLTLQTMILGEMSAAEATDALIAIQAQYKQSTEQLVGTIATLNMVENQTGISLKGLVQGFARAAGTAAMAGIDVRHLAAMLAAMTPAAGSAAQAGNALKTIISRLFAPTKDAADVLGKMGINVNSVAWQSANGSKRIELLSTAFEKLTGAQKSVVSSILASRFQINKFGVLMDSVAAKTDKNGNTTSYYARALESTAKQGAVFAQMQKELNQVLSSNPQRLKQIWTILQNAMADIIQPLIPFILMLADAARRLFQAFQNLSPEMQKFIGVGIIFLALFGPMLRYLGSTIVLIRELGFFFQLVIAPLGMVAGLFSTVAKTAGGMLAPALLLLRGAIFGITGVIASLGGFLKLGLVAFMGWARALVGPVFATFATVFTTAFGVLGRNLVQVWGTAWYVMQVTVQKGIMVQIGLFNAFRVAMMTSGLMFWRTLVTIWAAGSATMVGAVRLLALNLAAGFASMWLALRTIFIGGAISMTLGFSKAIMAIPVLLKALPMMIVRFVPMMFTAFAAVGNAAVIGLTSPIGLAIAAVIGLLILFRKQIRQILENIVGYFYQLPGGIQGAFRAVIETVKAAAMAVYGWLQYLNPFARHSPSLVDNVRSGMAIVRAELASVTSVSGALAKSSADLQKYGKVIANLKNQMASAQRADDRAAIGKVNPNALPAFDALNRDLVILNHALLSSASAVSAQERVVNAWSASLDRANAALDSQQKKLDAAQANLSKYQDLLSSAKDRLATFASTPIKGMQAMSDKLFANEMAQKKLRLEMLKMDQAVGGIDKVRGRLDKLNGEMELAQGAANDLRAKGAGSDILGAYNNQIDAIEQQKKAIKQTLKPYDDLSNALDNLARQGEILDLTNSLQFDPLTRQIEQAANAMKEMPFDQIMAGIRGAQSDITKYGKAVDDATAAVARQQAVVDAATAARDAISARYDEETKKLQQLKDSYSQVQDAISAVESALRDMTGAAEDSIRRQEAALERAKKKKAGKAISPQLAAFNAAGAANDFPSVTGAGGLGRQGIAGDQSKLIDDFTKDLAKQTAGMFAGFDMFAPIKKKWNEFKTWLNKELGPVKDFVKKAFAGVDFMAPFKNWDFSWLQKVKDSLIEFGTTLQKWGGDLWDLIGPDLRLIWDNLVAGFRSIWQQIKPELAKFGELIKPMGEALQNVWTVIKPILGLAIGLFLGLASTLLYVLGSVIKPVFEAIGGILSGFLSTVRGIIRLVVSIFTGDFKGMGTALKEIFGGIVKMIMSLITGLGKTLWALVKGIVEGVVNFFKWLWDKLVGHSIIPDIVNGIVAWIKKLASIPQWLYDNFLKPIFTKISAWWTGTLSPKVSSIITGITNFFKSLGGLPQWLWDHSFKLIYDKMNNMWLTYLKPLGNRMIRGFANIFNSIGRAIVAGVNIGIGAINKLIDGINWVGSHVPGLSFSIGKLGTAIYSPWVAPQFAMGGNLPESRVGQGFKTHGIRAIVGEGNPNHPEFVIPTDPKYRKRSIGLIAQAAQEVGIGFAQGGVLGRIKDAIISTGSSLAKGAVNKVLDPIFGTVKGMLSRLDNRLHLRDIAQAGVNSIRNWGREVEKALPDVNGRINPGLDSALRWAKAQSGKPYVWGGVGPGGYDCSGFMSAIENVIEGKYPHSRRFATGNFPTANFAPGMGAFSIGYFRGSPGHMAGTLNGVNVESSGGIGAHWGTSARGAQSPMFGGRVWHLKGYEKGGMLNHMGDRSFDLLSPAGKYYMGDAFRRRVRAQTYDTGGVLRPGYTLAYNGTGRNERVVTASQENGGPREIHFHGDMSFPNVRDGGDAEEFIKNLEVLAGGR